MSSFWVQSNRGADIMEEKIRVSLPKSVLALMKKDCEDFKILKGSAGNMNAFVNLLIANFYESFCGVEESVRLGAREALAAVPERYREDAYQKVLALVAREEQRSDAKEESVVLAFKPTKTSETAMLYIESTILPFQSTASFFRRMFVSYSKKTKNEREKLVHLEVFKKLQAAIEQDVTVTIKLLSGDILTNASVYGIFPAKEELFNYALIYAGHNQTIRLAKISAVTLLANKADIPALNKEYFKKQAECAPQYPIYNTDFDEIKVALTQRGKELFEKIYLYRPTPVRIEGDIYVFNCSAHQLMYYFERFGDSALILSPKRLGIAMRNYYHFALKKYRRQYPKD